MATITATITAPFGELDIEAATLLVKKANRRREIPFPMSTTAELRASAETALSDFLTEKWDEFQASAAAQAQQKANITDLWKAASVAKRDQVIALLSA